MYGEIFVIGSILIYWICSRSLGSLKDIRDNIKYYYVFTFTFYINSLLVALFYVSLFAAWWYNKNLFSLLFFFTLLFPEALTTIWYIFIMAIFKLWLFSSHATSLHTRLTEFYLLIDWLCLDFLYAYASSPMNIFEVECSVFAFSRAQTRLYCCLCILFTLLVLAFVSLSIIFFLILMFLIYL